jgi:hypothetical protein
MPVTATFHPLRDGSNGGQFMAIRLPNGCLMGDLDAEVGADAGTGGNNAGPNAAENTRLCAEARPRIGQ